MMEDYLKTHLVCIACDGTAVIMDSKSGVTKIMEENSLL
jgi:hypothetical protein